MLAIALWHNNHFACVCTSSQIQNKRKWSNNLPSDVCICYHTLPCISCNASLNFIYYVEDTMNIISLMTFPNIENQGEMNAVFYIMKQLIQQLLCQ